MDHCTAPARGEPSPPRIREWNDTDACTHPGGTAGPLLPAMPPGLPFLRSSVLELGHPDDVVATVDVEDLAGRRAREVAAEVDRGVADVVDAEWRPHRRDLAELRMHLLEPGDPG